VDLVQAEVDTRRTPTRKPYPRNKHEVDRIFACFCPILFWGRPRILQNSPRFRSCGKVSRRSA